MASRLVTRCLAVFPPTGPNCSNGTPRQPLLVPAARSVLKLAPFVSADCLQGLQQYSHCWVLYLFHANTSGWRGLSLARR